VSWQGGVTEGLEVVGVFANSTYGRWPISIDESHASHDRQTDRPCQSWRLRSALRTRPAKGRTAGTQRPRRALSGSSGSLIASMSPRRPATPLGINVGQSQPTHDVELTRSKRHCRPHGQPLLPAFPTGWNGLHRSDRDRQPNGGHDRSRLWTARPAPHQEQVLLRFALGSGDQR
jgi:hypothetical protein